MSETAPLTARTPAVTETPPVRAPQPGSEGKQEQNAQQQGTSTEMPPKAKAPDFKDPAIALSPRVAGIKVGDILEGQVQRIDGQQRAVVQNAKETLLVDPAADLKTGGQAKIRVTQTTRQFLGQIISSNPKTQPDIPVRLALVAVRGLDMKQPEGQTAPTTQPNGQSPAQTSSPQSSNSVADILRTVARPEPSVNSAALTGRAAVSKTSAVDANSAQPTLIKADVSRPGPTQAQSAAFEARHPHLSAAPRPITMTILPVSGAQTAYLRAPAAGSPLGHLIGTGRAIMANVEPYDSARPTATGRIPLSAGALKINIPNLPDLPLRAGEKVLLLSANAAPAPSTRQSLGSGQANAAPKALTPTATGDTPPTSASSAASTVWPALHNLLGQAVQTSPQVNPILLSTRSAQILSAMIGLPLDHDVADETKTLSLPKGVAEKANLTETAKQTIAALLKSAPDGERMLRAQMEGGLQQMATTGAAGAAVTEPVIMPLILPNTEATLIASLFLFPAAQDEAQNDDGAALKDKDRSQDKDFEVALTFERFGRTMVKGRIEHSRLQLTVETQHAVPEALERGLMTVFKDQCDACGYTGSIAFQSAE